MINGVDRKSLQKNNFKKKYILFVCYLPFSEILQSQICIFCRFRLKKYILSNFI